MAYYIIGIVLALFVVVLISIALSGKSDKKTNKKEDTKSTKKAEIQHKIRKRSSLYFMLKIVFFILMIWLDLLMMKQSY